MLSAIFAKLWPKCTESFTAPNFGVSEYTDSTGRKLPMYLLSKDGLMMVTMGYTTPEAMRIKEAYIARFNEMDEQLRSASPAIPDFQNPALAAWGKDGPLPAHQGRQPIRHHQDPPCGSHRGAPAGSQAGPQPAGEVSQGELNHSEFVQQCIHIAEKNSRHRQKREAPSYRPMRAECRYEGAFLYPASWGTGGKTRTTEMFIRRCRC